MVWTQVRTEALSVLIWVQTVCKGYQQTTKATDSKERVKKKCPCLNKLSVSISMSAVKLQHYMSHGAIKTNFIPPCNSSICFLTAY